MYTFPHISAKSIHFPPYFCKIYVLFSFIYVFCFPLFWPWFIYASCFTRTGRVCILYSITLSFSPKFFYNTHHENEFHLSNVFAWDNWRKPCQSCDTITNRPITPKFSATILYRTTVVDLKAYLLLISFGASKGRCVPPTPSMLRVSTTNSSTWVLVPGFRPPA